MIYNVYNGCVGRWSIEKVVGLGVLTGLGLLVGLMSACWIIKEFII